MKKRILIFFAAALFCSCTNSNRTLNSKAISPLCAGLKELAKADRLISGTDNEMLYNYIDSVTKTINYKEAYEKNLLKTYEMQYSIANGIAFIWVNTAINKYMTTDSTVILTNNSKEKDKDMFQNAIVQSLLTATESLNKCYEQEDIDLHNLSTFAFNTLNSFNTFFFCYYFVSDNQDYLTFFSHNSQNVDALHNYAEALFTCGHLSDEDAFKLASTIESTAFLITMSTLSFNIIWNKYEEEIQECADFFNQHSDATIKALQENDFEGCTILASEKEYTEYIEQAAKYKQRIMELVIDGIKNHRTNVKQ